MDRALPLRLVAFGTAAAAIIGALVFGLVRVNEASFKNRCSLYQTHQGRMSFPDNALCLGYWHIK